MGPLRRAVNSSNQFFHQLNHQFQITNFSVSSHQNVLYNSVAILGIEMFIATELYSTFWWLETEDWWFEIGDLIGDYTKNWWLEWSARLNTEFGAY